MVRNTSKKTYAKLLRDPRMLSLEDPAYATVTAAYRHAAGLPPVHVEPATANFSGTWILDEEKSSLGRRGAAFAPARLDTSHEGNSFTVRTTRILEYADDEVTKEKLTLDGTESHSEFMNSPRVTRAHLSPDGTQLIMDSTVQFSWGSPDSKSQVHDTWQLDEGGSALTIHRTANTPIGPQTTTMVFDLR